jgi:hypothetical protein
VKEKKIMKKLIVILAMGISQFANASGGGQEGHGYFAYYRSATKFLEGELKDLHPRMQSSLPEGALEALALPVDKASLLSMIKDVHRNYTGSKKGPGFDGQERELWFSLLDRPTPEGQQIEALAPFFERFILRGVEWSKEGYRVRRELVATALGAFGYSPLPGFALAQDILSNVERTDCGSGGSVEALAKNCRQTRGLRAERKLTSEGVRWHQLQYYHHRENEMQKHIYSGAIYPYLYFDHHVESWTDSRTGKIWFMKSHPRFSGTFASAHEQCSKVEIQRDLDTVLKRSGRSLAVPTSADWKEGVEHGLLRLNALPQVPYVIQDHLWKGFRLKSHVFWADLGDREGGFFNPSTGEISADAPQGNTPAGSQDPHAWIVCVAR